jgi:hypothetical protein
MVDVLEVFDADLDLGQMLGSERCRRKERLIRNLNLTVFQLGAKMVRLDMFGGAKLILFDGGVINRGFEGLEILNTGQ